MNLRGKFISDERGCVAFATVRPAGYPIPVNGPVGDLLRALGRHNMRPAHVHFLIFKPGYKTHISQVYSDDDPNLNSDVQFGVTQALVGRMVRHTGEAAPDPAVRGPWWTLTHTLILDRGEAALPQPPITGKATGERPILSMLPRRA